MNYPGQATGAFANAIEKSACQDNACDNSNAQDFSAIAIKKSGADVLGTNMTIAADHAIFSKRLRHLGVNIPRIGSPTHCNVTTRTLAGAALHGTY